MNKQLAGISLIKSGFDLDYCFRHAILSLVGVCDHVFVTLIPTEDGTAEDVKKLAEQFPITIIECTNEEWEEQKGKEKLSYFTNIAIDRAQKEGYEWVLYVQGDEVLDDRSYGAIRTTIEKYPNEEAFLVNRINLWGDSQHYLTCPQNRMPCSIEVIRLAKSHCRAIGDAESLNGHCRWILDEVDIWHMGFVRDKHKMIPKVRTMQEKVFGMDADPALDTMTDGWDPWVSHSKDDVKPIKKPLPELIQKWAADRDEQNKKPATLDSGAEVLKK